MAILLPSSAWPAAVSDCHLLANGRWCTGLMQASVLHVSIKEAEAALVILPDRSCTSQRVSLGALLCVCLRWFPGETQNKVFLCLADLWHFPSCGCLCGLMIKT